jgi:hypothetical protein
MPDDLHGVQVVEGDRHFNGVADHRESDSCTYSVGVVAMGTICRSFPKRRRSLSKNGLPCQSCRGGESGQPHLAVARKLRPTAKTIPMRNQLKILKKNLDFFVVMC